MAQNATEKGGGPSLSSTDSVVSCNGLRLSYGNHAVLDDATIAVHEGEKIGVVGRNGSGKSSFLKILSGAERPDGGDIARKSNLVTGYLSQEFTLREEATVLDNVRDGAADVLTLIHRYENAADLSPTEAQRIHDQIDAADGWTLETHLETVMQALDCPSIDRRVDSLSGGEKRRVALCRALAGRPDLLVLDEPTNHLDAESILWLEGYLVSFRGAVVFVTHDRYFLDRIATRIAELDLGKFFTHEGNYSDYLEARAERQAVSRNAETRRQSFLRRELQWVRAGVKARTTKARSRLDSYYRIAEKDAPEQELDMDLILPKPPPLGNIVVDLENVGAVLGGKRLFAHFNMKFEPGRKIGIVGRNGLGKTTLLRILMGEMEPTEGRVSIGKKTVFNYVDQNRVSLDESRSILDEVGEGSEFVQFGAGKLSVRGYLRRFLFTDERLTERIGILSGGEKNRVLLAKILRNGGNFLVLDEPTNDLDLQTLRVLEEALLAFQGVVVVVSHDRYFLDRVADQTIAFEGDGVVTVNEGGWSYYLEKRQQRLAAQSARAKTQTPAKVSAAPDKPTSESRERPRKLSWKEERELEGIEPAIEKGEAKAAELEALLHDPDFYRENAARVPEVTAELETLRAELERLYTRWQELESVRAAAETR